MLRQALHWCRRGGCPGNFCGGNLPENPENLLETEYRDFDRFIHLYEIAGDHYLIRISKGETACFQAYRIEIAASVLTITANDTESVRRGLIYVDDLLRKKENACFEPGTVQ